MDDQLRILIVDDDQVDRMAVRRALKAGGVHADVHEAADVDSALAALRSGGIDCAFLDYQLPGGDGMRVLRTVREEEITTPVVMLTGQENTQTAVELMKAGAADYLAKDSLSPEVLERSLRHAVRVHQAEVQAERAEEALRESEARFRVLHETSPDGFMVFGALRDASGAIEDFVWNYTNPAAERMLGRTAAYLEGKRLLHELPATRDTGLFDLYRRVVETGKPTQSEVQYDEDGIDTWFRFTAVPLHDGLAVGFSDITRRREAEEEREQAIAARARFYASMSHELRTPINAVIGYNDLMLAGIYGDMNEQQLQGIARSQNAARHLLELVNDVLDLSKVEAGKVEIEVEPVSIPALVDDLFTTVGPLAERQGTELHLHCGEELPRLETDPRRVRQILLNLLSNAIKFGEGKPVEVHCTRAGEGGARIEVRDHGTGIPAEAVDRIFDEFVQLPSGNEGGTGLGLSISRRLADLLGGALSVQSVEGEGSTFRLTLPERAPALPAPPDA